MQHGRVTSALAARVLAGRSRVMSVLMALCLFAAGALAIPGFAARADNNDGPLPIPNTTFVINLENASEFEAEYGKTGYWGVILDNGGVTPTAPQPDDPQLPVVQPTATSSASPSATPSASASPAANATQPSDTPVSPVSDVSELTDANKGGVSAAFTGGQLTINVPSDKAGAGEWVSANIMQTGEARWLQVEDGNKVTMDVASLPMGEYKVVVANRSHQLVGWADFKVASTVGAAGAGASVDASDSVKLHAEVLSSSNAADESEGLNGYLLGAGACMLILGGLVVLQVLSGPKIGSSSQGVTLT